MKQRIERRKRIPVQHLLCLAISAFQISPYSLVPYSGVERTRRHCMNERRFKREKTYLFSLLLKLWKICKHFLHVIEIGGAFTAENVRRCEVVKKRCIYPLNTAFSSRNLLKSSISLSIASRICKCRTAVQTVSASESTAVLSSYAPSDD